MNEFLIWSLAFPNISAQRVFVCVYTMLGSNVGQLREVTTESLVVKLDELGLRTERGKFTQRTVSSRLKDLVRSGLASVEKNPDATLNITLFRPSEVLGLAKKEKQVERVSQSEKNAVQQSTKTETVSVTESVEDERAYKENNNINTTQENKQINAPNVRSIDSLVDGVDFTRPAVANVRRYIAKQIYEEGLHADLVDRATVAIVRGVVSKAELDAAIRESRDRKRQLETTNGFKGAYHLWETFALKVKAWFDGLGVLWTATSFRRERRPAALVDVSSEAAEARILANDAKRRATSALRPMRKERELCTR